MNRLPHIGQDPEDLPEDGEAYSKPIRPWDVWMARAEREHLDVMEVRI